MLIADENQLRRVKFVPVGKEDFLTVIRKRVTQYFKDKELSHHANWKVHIKTGLLLILFIGSYGMIISDHFQGFSLISLYIFIGMMQTLMGFNIVHDSLHGAYSYSSKINKILGHLFDLNGTSTYIWKATHNGQHHTYTNIPGEDQDIEKAIILRFSPKDQLYKFHYFQHWYAPVLYCFTSFFWIYISDYLWFFREAKKNPPPLSEYLVFLFFKPLNLIIYLFFPLFYLSVPWWQVVLGCLAMQMVAGFVMSLVFQLAHLVEGTEFPEPDSQGKMPYDWGIHEMVTTCNFATKNRLLSLFLGGLNFQIEHHLFPYICHVHYPQIAKIVKNTAREFGIPYNESPTFLGAIRSHFRKLKQLGRTS